MKVEFFKLKHNLIKVRRVNYLISSINILTRQAKSLIYRANI